MQEWGMWMWLIAGVVMGGAEMLVGTFYLLVLALGCFLAAAVAWCDASLAWQLVTCAISSVIGGLYVRRLKAKKDVPSESLQNMDVGQTVTVQAWNDDGTAQVMYRGTTWIAFTPQEGEREPGVFRIIRVEGPRLIVVR